MCPQFSKGKIVPMLNSKECQDLSSAKDGLLLVLAKLKIVGKK